MPRSRKRRGRFVGIPFHIARSAEIDQLSPYEFLLLFQLFRQYSGKNNGDFSCTWSMMERAGWRSQATLNKAKKGLLDKGWIEETRKGYTGCCSLYAVTWEAIDDCNGKLDVKATNRPSMLFKKIKVPATGGVA